jgi:hypothetical protein
MTLFHPVLLGAFVFFCALWFLPDLAVAFPNAPGAKAFRTTITHTDRWRLVWSVMIVPCVLLELGRWLPWVVIRSLPELTLAGLVLAMALAVRARSHRSSWQREFQYAGPSDAGWPAAEILRAWCYGATAALLIWLGGQLL